MAEVAKTSGERQPTSDGPNSGESNYQEVLHSVAQRGFGVDSDSIPEFPWRVRSLPFPWALRALRNEEICYVEIVMSRWELHFDPLISFDETNVPMENLTVRLR